MGTAATARDDELQQQLAVRQTGLKDEVLQQSHPAICAATSGTDQSAKIYDWSLGLSSLIGTISQINIISLQSAVGQ